MQIMWLIMMIVTMGFAVVTPGAKADTGGPDIEGYYWTDNNPPAPTVPFNWIDGITGGTPLGLWDDAYVGPFPIGFTFNYYGIGYDDIYVSSNGFITFTDQGTSWWDGGLPSTNTPNNEIVPFGDDLDPGAGGEVYYKFITGTPDQFVVTWDAVPYCGSPEQQTFQIVLNETGDIWFNYQNFTDPGWWPTIGIENHDGTVGLNYPNGPADNLAIRFGQPEFPYDIAVENFQAPDYAVPNVPFYVNATIRNRGDFTENNIEVNFTVNGTLQNQTIIPTLASGGTYNASFMWTPPAEENYTVEINVTPITNEIYTLNNNRSKVVIVYTPIAYLLIDEAHNNWMDDYEDFIQDQIDQKYWVNYTSDPLNSTILANHNVLVSIRPQSGYSASELVDIRDFLNNTGGLLVIGGTNQGVLNPLTDYSGITWNGPQASNMWTTTTNIVPHPTTTGIGTVYYSWHGFSIETTGAATGVVYDDAFVTIQGAASTYNYGKVFAVNARYDFDNNYLFNWDNLQYSRNIVSWLLVPPEDHDLAVTNLSAPRYTIPGQGVYINATIVNNGLNAEANIVVNFSVNGTLQDFRNIANIAPLEQVNVDFPWTPPAEENYTVEINVTVVPGETNTLDNNRSKVVSAYYPTAYLLIDDAHNNNLNNYNNFIQDQIDRKYWINYTNDPIDSAILSQHDVLISIRPWNSYSVDEISNISSFVANGGGLLVVGSTDPNILNPLTNYSGLTWNGPQASNTWTSTPFIVPHPTTSGITWVFYTWSWFSIDGSMTPVVFDDMATTVQGAANIYEKGKIFAVNGEDDFGWELFSWDNLKYSRNIIAWLIEPFPEIISTTPVADETDVTINQPIIVQFNKEMDPATFSFTCNPNPGGWNWIWSSTTYANDTVTGTHNDFSLSTPYEFNVTACNDINGDQLTPGPVPNPWSFTTTSVNPIITSTNPADNDVDVTLDADVIVTFNEPMNTASVTWWCSDFGLGWSEFWSGGDTVLTLSHTTNFTDETTYTFNITGGQDALENPLNLSAGAQNPWNFTTIPIDNLTVLGYDQAPLTVQTSEANVVMLNLTLTADT
ncbi:MAG: Ig-like domain-containing protein, partial [Thermoplasmata archaeon]|nr:Ig-like domain-containing protein [Thermoplasmata archaeon]